MLYTHNIKWFVLTFVIYLVEVIQDRGKGITYDYTQTPPGPSQDPPVDEVS